MCPKGPLTINSVHKKHIIFIFQRYSPSKYLYYQIWSQRLYTILRLIWFNFFFFSRRNRNFSELLVPETMSLHGFLPCAGRSLHYSLPCAEQSLHCSHPCAEQIGRLCSAQGWEQCRLRSAHGRETCRLHSAHGVET